jgi:hypothetical protein
MDFYAGDKMGRVWRIVPNQPRAQRNLKINLGQASVAELVKRWNIRTAGIASPHNA